MEMMLDSDALDENVLQVGGAMRERKQRCSRSAALPQQRRSIGTP